MKRLQFGFSSALVAVAALAVGSVSPQSAEARPKYKETIAEKYPGLAAQVEKVKCGVCHPPGAEEKKKARNNYGKALEKALGAKNVSDKEKIMKAMATIESEKSATEGKTFGDLIKAGVLPGKNE